MITDALPLIIAAISLVGSGIAFVMSNNERKSLAALNEASAAQQLGESYKGLIESLETRVANLEAELAESKAYIQELEARLDI